MKKLISGQIQISLAVGVLASIAYIVTPVLWVSGTNQTFAIQQTKQDAEIQTLQQNYQDLKLSTDRLNKAMDKLLFRAGIDPTTIK